MSAGTLEALLAEHIRLAYGMCSCGWESSGRYRQGSAEHRAHLAAAIREWALADEQVERAGTAVYDLDLGLGLNGSESERFALAALAAIFGGDA